MASLGAEHIHSADHDWLDRSQFCDLVSSVLLGANSDTATIVGLNGSWGSGKTWVGREVSKRLSTDKPKLYSSSHG